MMIYAFEDHLPVLAVLPVVGLLRVDQELHCLSVDDAFPQSRDLSEQN